VRAASGRCQQATISAARATRRVASALHDEPLRRAGGAGGQGRLGGRNKQNTILSPALNPGTICRGTYSQESYDIWYASTSQSV
jgi:hypothetical protein